jgi:hypothetical protein
MRVIFVKQKKKNFDDSLLVIMIYYPVTIHKSFDEVAHNVFVLSMLNFVV